MAKQRLGKGLEALIPVHQEELSSNTNQPHLPVGLIDPNPLQPRKEFGDEGMTDLINSVKAKGILQPITVRESGDGRYQLVAGERRLRVQAAPPVPGLASAKPSRLLGGRIHRHPRPAIRAVRLRPSR